LIGYIYYNNYIKIGLIPLSNFILSISYIYFNLLPKVKLPTREADCSPLSRAEVIHEWSHTSIPPIRLHDVYRDNFTFCIWLSK